MFEVVLAYGPSVLVDAHDYEIDADGDLVFWNDMDDGSVEECGRFVAGSFVGVHTVEVEDDEEVEEVDAE